ncbi:MAG: glycosyltransferase family 4 protein [Anaerolineae bacterium]|jgi:glycosyltransferase involved in cell wall biosynthesis
MPKPTLHQFIVGALPGDAITDQALLLRRWLRQAGIRSEIYAESIDEALAGEVRSYLQYSPSRPGELVVLHHSIGSAAADWLLGEDVRFLLVYHNITPPRFFAGVDPGLGVQLRKGRRQLESLCGRTVLGLADSLFNERELQATGFSSTGVLPIALDRAQYDIPPSLQLMARYGGGGPNLLFVGRLAPNKRQGDLIKLLYHLRRIHPASRLFLVGLPWVKTYEVWLRGLAHDLGLENAVVFADHVSQSDLVAYFQLADFYVSMSEHEGFGKPLVESMLFDLPVVAFAAGAVPETLGGAGVLFRHKDHEALAELIDLLVVDEALRQRVLARQRERVRRFMAPAVRRRWSDFLARVGYVVE